MLQVAYLQVTDTFLRGPKRLKFFIRAISLKLLPARREE